MLAAVAPTAVPAAAIPTRVLIAVMTAVTSRMTVYGYLAETD